MPKISDARKDERRRQILDAAWACFEREGLHATTMQDIIRASGLSAGAVYGYFPSKEELVVVAVTTSLTGLSERLAPMLQRAPPAAPDALLGEITEAILGFTRRDGYDLRRIALLGWSEAQRNPRLRGIMQAQYGAFREGLRGVALHWRAGGAIDPAADPDAVAKAFLAQILGYVVQSALLDDVLPADMEAGLRGLSGA